MIANGGHMTDDLMAGNAGIEGAVPFGTDLVQVRMADAAIGDIDRDIMRTDGAAFDVEGFERLVGGVGAIGFGGHGDVPLLEVCGVQGGYAPPLLFLDGRGPWDGLCLPHVGSRQAVD